MRASICAMKTFLYRNAYCNKVRCLVELRLGPTRDTLEHGHQPCRMARLRLSPLKKPTPSKQRSSTSTIARIKSRVSPKTTFRELIDQVAF